MKLRTLFIIALLPGLIGCAKWYKPLLAPVGVAAMPFVVVLWGVSMKKYHSPEYHFYSLPIEAQANATYKNPWSVQPNAGFNQWAIFTLDQKNGAIDLTTNPNDKVVVLRTGDAMTIDLDEPLTVSGASIACCLSESNFHSRQSYICFYSEDGERQTVGYTPYGWNVGNTINGNSTQTPRHDGRFVYLNAKNEQDDSIIGRLCIREARLERPIIVNKVEFIYGDLPDGAELLIVAASLFHIEVKSEKAE
ncbi:MAG: hypothetical protein P9L94_06255 [Candidatus Hinthialibacter antarcticus]|nr:hypothetical protein [Candidatus Hinthialibacter antarcticus]